MIAAVTASLVSGCSTIPVPEGGAQWEQGSTLAFTLPVTSFIGRRFETVVRQAYDYSCGSAALATLLRYHYADPQSEQSVFVGMFRDGDQAQIRRLGFSLLDMKRYLAVRGISADGYQVTLAQIAKARTPGIALINFNGYRHFVVVKGIEGDTLILGDPSLGLRRERTATFLSQWNGVFFVINGQPGRAGFNLAADRDRAPAAPFAGTAQPLSLAGLSLTRPLPGEF